MTRCAALAGLCSAPGQDVACVLPSRRRRGLGVWWVCGFGLCRLGDVSTMPNKVGTYPPWRLDIWTGVECSLLLLFCSYSPKIWTLYSTQVYRKSDTARKVKGEGRAPTHPARSLFSTCSFGPTDPLPRVCCRSCRVRRGLSAGGFDRAWWLEFRALSYVGGWRGCMGRTEVPFVPYLTVVHV